MNCWIGECINYYVLKGYGNGDLSILYGDDQWGSIYSLDALTGSERWKTRNPEHGVTFIASGDFDKDDSANRG